MGLVFPGSRGKCSRAWPGCPSRSLGLFAGTFPQALFIFITINTKPWIKIIKTKSIMIIFLIIVIIIIIVVVYVYIYTYIYIHLFIHIYVFIYIYL